MNFITQFPLGQYVDGDKSWLRIIDSRLKLILISFFLISPIWAGSFWRIALVLSLILITFLSFLPLRVWWRSFLLLIFLSVFVGILTLLASSSITPLAAPLRDPDELNIILQNNENWNFIELPIRKIGFLNIRPLKISHEAFELGIKTSTLLFTVVHSVNLILLTTLKEDLVWAMSWYLKPLRKVGLPIDKWLFQLLLALRFIPLVQEEFQNIFKAFSVRSINFRNLGFKKSVSVVIDMTERLFLNILLRVEQGADALAAKNYFDVRISKFKILETPKILSLIVNTLSILFICLAIFLRKQYGAL